jgi:RND superfamily putative drug exporter
VIVGVASAALMLAAAAPLTHTTLTGPSSQVVPPGQPSYAPIAYLNAHYPRDVTEAVTVVLAGRPGAATRQAFGARLRALPGVVRATPFVPAGDLAYATLALKDPALSAPAQTVLDRIRDLPAPPGTRVLVTGNTARFADQKASLAAHAPLVIVIISAGTLLLLFLLTGSIILPLKTLLMNALTLAATLGLLVVGFQDGLLTDLLSDTGPHAVETTSLVFMFAITFALSTDYAVLVLARIKEQHDLGLPNVDAVAIGIGRTGRVISAAALMISVVFLAFAVSPVFFMKQIAVGMAVAVLLDSTVIRALLVPALMRLLGERNWGAPAPLARLQRRYGIREAPSVAADAV